jgi:hypothetical protein
MKTYDLNIFYADLGINDETGKNEWETRLTIQPYLYEQDSAGTRKTLVATFYATEAESDALRKAYPNGEYGDDWFDFLENFVKVAPARLVSLMSTLPDPEDAETIGEPLVIARAPYVPAYYEPHLMVWDDKPDNIVSVNIARIDIPAVAEMWDALTETERENLDSKVFYFVETEQELADLYTEGSGEFHLVKEN